MFVRKTLIMKLKIHILFTLTKHGYNLHSYWDVIQYSPRRTTRSIINRFRKLFCSIEEYYVTHKPNLCLKRAFELLYHGVIQNSIQTVFESSHFIKNCRVLLVSLFLKLRRSTHEIWDPLTSSLCVSLNLLTLETSAVDLYLGNMIFKFNQVH